MIREAPLIETDRLVLRGFRKDDFPLWFGILQQDAVSRYLGGNAVSREDCWRRIAASVGSWQLLGFGSWAVTLDGELVGNVGLFNAWRALEPEFGEEPEMGWVFAPHVHGRGYAGEATRAVIDWAEANLQPTPIWAIVDPQNEPSLRLGEKLGFERINETSYHDEPTVVLKRPAWA